MGLNRGQIGELNRRITLRKRQDAPTGAFGMLQTFSDSTQLWAKVEIMAGSVLQDGQQTANVATHRFWIRYRRDVGVDHEILYDGKTYRVRRATDWEDARRFTILEAEELHG